MRWIEGAVEICARKRCARWCVLTESQPPVQDTASMSSSDSWSHPQQIMAQWVKGDSASSTSCSVNVTAPFSPAPSRTHRLPKPSITVANCSTSVHADQTAGRRLRCGVPRPIVRETQHGSAAALWGGVLTSSWTACAAVAFPRSAANHLAVIVFATSGATRASSPPRPCCGRCCCCCSCCCGGCKSRFSSRSCSDSWWRSDRALGCAGSEEAEEFEERPIAGSIPLEASSFPLLFWGDPAEADRDPDVDPDVDIDVDAAGDADGDADDDRDAAGDEDEDAD